MFFLFFLLLLSSCHYPRIALDSEELTGRQRDSLACLYKYNYTWNTNLELRTDSVELACLPVKDSYKMLHRGDRVVVAEFAIHPADSVDSVWVKLAHTQEVQGWLRQSDMKRDFAPTDSISQAIYLFSDTHASYFVIVFALFVAAWLFRAFRKKQLKLVYFDDIDSVYPLLLCLLMAFSATIYESMQVFVPATWEQFYYNPTLSPFKVPFVLSVFLTSIWLFLIVLLAVLDDLFRQLSPAASHVLSAGTGFELHLLLFLLHSDHAHLCRLSVFGRVCLDICTPVAPFAACRPLPLRQLRRQDDAQRRMPALRSGERVAKASFRMLAF